jgi:hypothetical protein
VFHEGASTYSHLMAYSGAGSIAGALTVAWLGKFKRMGLTALLMQIVYGALIIRFALSRTLPLSEVLLFCTGFRADARLLDRDLAGAADCAQRNARPRDEHLHARVSAAGCRLAASSPDGSRQSSPHRPC